MTPLRICLLGGTGFVGRSLAARLVAAGHYVRIITRQRERHRDLLVLPTLHLIQADVHNPAVLAHEFSGMDAVINLVGVLNPRRRSGYARAHVELVQKIVAACAQANVPRVLHMSALGARVDAPSEYQRTKALGERILLAAPGLELTIFRPSVIFGAHDRFINRFARLLRRTPWLFPLACPQARLQPVYVEDVTRALLYALEQRATVGQCYPLCGPRVYTLAELLRYIAAVAGIERKIVPLSARASWLQASLLEYFPGKPFTRDNYLSLQQDNVCERVLPMLDGAAPTALETVVPAYVQPNNTGLDARRRA